MRVDVLTLFPEMFEGVFGTSILGKAQTKGLVSLNAVNFRDYATNKHNTVDDTPYGGGGGMVLKPDPIFAAVEDVLEKHSEESAAASSKPPRIILMCPQGETFTQKKAEELVQEDHLIFICGHYEGYDERIREFLVTDELSIGDYVLTGGELPAMVAIDSVARLIPGVLGNETSAVTDSFSTGLLEYPHYTRPPEFRGMKVPDVLLSGHHLNIDAWRREQSLIRTLERRPDMLDTAELTEKERLWLDKLRSEMERTSE
ncbi:MULTISPECIES: tRNA (guanosine(37)-N1)-methyltransferase TrmD [Paenibacillus]|uniref:tRNA (guanosine(37)-N1)-methyltransferase TrmD n=1 Tax=Paenibacillus TaxID=44249 RepID=UPI00129D9225|nr:MULTISPECIES: tRNA (guanosine(37)-N1)-methyltransferase TrmD [Paenibacillus]MBE7679296.1 tRNA (guanosine(37)-N1)-methyltransferase TrmD [Paenibacillus sp. P13VS]MBY0218630.1 tRNA (guanosine(37)-N1)-methyltransferase TrmD [Paenibacillus illinoisensis]MCM3205141.1 tRNA (guanosine(37)-N1)-methyltransferase TrmD [Paenibacillus illinoisensis]